VVHFLLASNLRRFVRVHRGHRKGKSEHPVRVVPRIRFDTDDEMHQIVSPIRKFDRHRLWKRQFRNVYTACASKGITRQSLCFEDARNKRTNKQKFTTTRTYLSQLSPPRSIVATPPLRSPLSPPPRVLVSPTFRFRLRVSLSLVSHFCIPTKRRTVSRARIASFAPYLCREQINHRRPLRFSLLSRRSTTDSSRSVVAVVVVVACVEKPVD